MADRDNHCIQVFTAKGRFLRMVGGRVMKVKPTNMTIKLMPVI